MVGTLAGSIGRASLGLVRFRIAVSGISVSRVAALLVAATFALSGCGLGSGPPSGRVAPIGAPTAGGSVSAPPIPAGRAPTRTFDVATRSDTYTRDGTRVLKTTAWYPKTSGRYPLVVFSHGLQGLPADFAPLLRQWAAAGFVIVAPAYPKTSRGAAEFDVLDVLNQPADASLVVTRTLAGPLKSIIDPARVGAAGHSGGAITTIGLFTIGRDDRLRAGVVFAGAAIGVGTNFVGTPAPLFFVHGDADEVVSFASGKAVFDALRWPKALLTLPGEGHSAPFQREGSPSFKTVAASTLDFLRYSLYGDPDAKSRLAKDANPAGKLDNRL
jgi:dienelactone hydrolase